MTNLNGASGARGKRVAAPYAAGGALNISDLALNQVAATILVGARGGPERSLDVTSAGARGQAA